MNCDSSVSLSKLQLTKAPEAPRGPAGVSSAEVHGEQVGQLGSSPQTGSGVGPQPVTFHSQPCDVPLSGAEPHVQGTLSVHRAQLWWISSEDAPQVKWEDLLSHQPHPSPRFLKRSCALILSTEILHGIMQFLNYFISSFPLPPQERREPEGKTEGTFLFQPLWCVWKTILQQ